LQHGLDGRADGDSACVHANALTMLWWNNITAKSTAGCLCCEFTASIEKAKCFFPSVPLNVVRLPLLLLASSPSTGSRPPCWVPGIPLAGREQLKQSHQQQGTNDCDVLYAASSIALRPMPVICVRSYPHPAWFSSQSRCCYHHRARRSPRFLNTTKW